VFTEAATGAYVVTPILAALAGAKRVIALSRTSSHGTVAVVTEHTRHIAELAGVNQAIDIVTEKTREDVADADIITNSAHVRPLDATMVGWMKSTAVVPLMYEAWEFRRTDVDLEACRRRGIRVAGTNERHPLVDVFSYLGPLAAKLLFDSGLAVYGSAILLLSDNPFLSYLKQGLGQLGASVTVAPNVSAAPRGRRYDAILVALRPRREPVLDADSAFSIAKEWPGAVVAQFWGDVDRNALLAAGVPVWPQRAPAPGHMAILLSALGPEPIVRLQAGGLKVGEVLLRGARSEEASYLQWPTSRNVSSPTT
jgi:hypothetical protein